MYSMRVDGAPIMLRTTGKFSGAFASLHVVDGIIRCANCGASWENTRMAAEEESMGEHSEEI